MHYVSQVVAAAKLSQNQVASASSRDRQVQWKARTVGILVHQQRCGEVQQVCNAHDQQPRRLQAPRSCLQAAGELLLDTLPTVNNRVAPQPRRKRETVPGDWG